MLFAIGVPMASASAYQTGFDLYQRCSVNLEAARTTRETLDGLKCVDYLIGYIDGIGLAATRTGSNGIACLPEEMLIGQARLVFNAWASKHTNKLHYPAFLALALALGEAFPCP